MLASVAMSKASVNINHVHVAGHIAINKQVLAHNLLHIFSDIYFVHMYLVWVVEDINITHCEYLVLTASLDPNLHITFFIFLVLLNLFD